MIYTLPIIGGIIGYITNYIAVQMLFHPRKPKRFLCITIQGIFPKKKHILARKVAKVYVDEIITLKDMKGMLITPEFLANITETIGSKMDDYLQGSLGRSIGFLRIFVGKRMKRKIKESAMAQIENALPELAEQTITDLAKSLDIEDFIYKKVANYSDAETKGMMFGVLEKEFRFIEFAGAVLGAIIGAVQLVILLVFY